MYLRFRCVSSRLVIVLLCQHHARNCLALRKQVCASCAAAVSAFTLGVTWTAAGKAAAASAFTASAKREPGLSSSPPGASQKQLRNQHTHHGFNMQYLA